MFHLIFESDEDEEIITKEFCKYLVLNRDIIPQEEFTAIVMGMYFNIVEYINEDEREDYMEMINMTTVLPSVIDVINKEYEKEIEAKVEAKIKAKVEAKVRQDIFSTLSKNLNIDESKLRELIFK